MIIFIRVYRITVILHSLISSFLENRSITIAINGLESKVYPTSTGVPQGTFLGPLLLNIFFDHLLYLITETVACTDELTVHRGYSKQDSVSRVPDIEMKSWLVLILKQYLPTFPWMELSKQLKCDQHNSC